MLDIGPETVCTAGISQHGIGDKVSLKSISSVETVLDGELPLLSARLDAGDVDADSWGYLQLNFRNEQ